MGISTFKAINTHPIIKFLRNVGSPLIAAGTVLGFFGIDFSILAHDKPKLTVEVTSEKHFVPIGEEFQDISVSYRGMKVRNDNSLKLLVIQVSNTGSKPITPADFQPKSRWGLKTKASRVLSAKIIGSDSEKIADYLNPIIDGEHIVFTPVIFEPDRYVLLRVVLLANKAIPTNLTHFGAINGIDDVPVLSLDQWQKKNVLKRAFEGRGDVHIIRFFAYSIIAFAFYFTFRTIFSKLKILFTKIRTGCP